MTSLMPNLTHSESNGRLVRRNLMLLSLSRKRSGSGRVTRCRLRVVSRHPQFLWATLSSPCLSPNLQHRCSSRACRLIFYHPISPSTPRARTARSIRSARLSRPTAMQIRPATAQPSCLRKPPRKRSIPKTRAEVAAWVAEARPDKVLNRASKTFRALPVAVRDGLDETKAIDLMVAEPTMIQRPVLTMSHGIEVGFKPERYATIFGL